MLIRLLLVVFVLWGISDAYAQPPVQRQPANGANGYNGSTPRSFIIQWDSLAGAISYEYVVSDNSLCFAGCSGDTRHQVTNRTYAVEANLTLNKWYYWIIRSIKSNGDTSFYSPIHSFYTVARPEDARSYFTLSPNLITDHRMNIRVAWTIDPEITVFDFKIFNSFGQLMITSASIAPVKSELEQTEEFPVGLAGFQPGLYFIEISTNKSKVPERLKFLVSQ